MYRLPDTMSPGTGGLDSEVSTTPSLGSKPLMGGLLVLRQRRKGRAGGQARGWYEGDPQVEEPYGNTVFLASLS